MSTRRRLSPLFALLILFVITALTVPASANGPDPAGGWQWTVGGSKTAGWNFQECNVESSACGTASSTTIFQANVTDVVPSTSPATWGVGEIVCSDGSIVGAGWSATSAGPTFHDNFAKTICPDSFASTARLLFWTMQSTSSPGSSQVIASDPGASGIPEASYPLVAYLRYGAAPVVPSSPSCGSSLGDARAGWDGTHLSVSFQYTGSTSVTVMGNPPYFHIYKTTSNTAPFTPNTGQTIALMPAGDTAEGYAGYFYALLTPFSGTNPSSGSTIWLNVGTYGASGTCGVPVSVVDYTVTKGPATATHNDNNSDGSTNCGIGWNILTDLKCAATWAFVPSAGTMNGWNTRISSIESHPPVNIVTGGVSLANNVYDSANCSFDPNVVGNCYQTSGENAGTFHSMDGTSGNLNIVGAAAQFVQTTTGGGLIYTFERLGIWVLFLIWAIRRVSVSFGGKD